MTDQVHTTEAVVVRAEPDQSEIGGILRLAVEKNVGIDTIERLVALKERAEERSAASEFNGALAAFQSECPPIPKKSRAKITTKSGGEYGYSYAELDTIAIVIRPLLTKLGLSYSWDSELDAKGMLICTCTLRHVAGHAQGAKFILPTTTASAMSDQQKHAAALTYARRQSLIQVLGLTTTDHDNDGAAGADDAITEAQEHTIEEWLRDSGAELSKFLGYMKVGKVAEIKARDFTKAINALKAKKREREQKGGAA